ncbi:MAG: hypothetical protein HY054_11550 [Proteobacteria bacterium]|nr:hypothetical protein [Pseudomonadota bacterium]
MIGAARLFNNEQLVVGAHFGSLSFCLGKSMKKTFALIGTAAAALMFSGTAHADVGSGFVGLSYSNGNPIDLESVGIDGRVAFGSNIQLDAGYNSIHSGDLNRWDIGGHFFSRSDQWLWGGFVGYENFDASGGSADEWTVAGQTQYYVDKTILSGNLSYSRTNALGPDINTIQLTGDARFFATDNFTVHLGTGYGRIDVSGSNGNFWTYGGGAEWKPDQLPISIYGDIGVVDPDGGGSNSTTWTVGVRYNFGGGSIYDRERHGASLSSPRGFLDLLF